MAEIKLMQTILITGGTGLIGSALSKMLLEKKYAVIILTRQTQNENHKLQSTNLSYATWNIKEQTIDEEAIKRADHLIHLAGANVAEKRWSVKRKKEIFQSRVDSSALLVRALKEIPNKVKTVVSASGIGWYGEDPSIPNLQPYKETDPAAPGFLGETCQAWEESIQPITLLGRRLVKLRTGIVLAREGGAFPQFKRPVKFGMATILGGGSQVMSWIHIEDLCRMYLHVIEREPISGTFKAVAPNPISNKTFMIQLAERVRGRFYIPVHVPVFSLKLMLGEMSIEVLKSTTVSDQKIRHSGFQFLFPSAEAALGQLIKDPK